MKLTFIGTRGYIEARTQRHFMHTALLIEHRRKRIMVDAGEDWLGHLDKVRPHAIVLTHAHPDHAWGLKEGAPCPVYATEETWKLIHDYPIEERHTIELQKPAEVLGVTFEAFLVLHSVTAQTVGFRISAGRSAFFYGPDLVYIEDRAAALRECSLYIGDGATVTQSFVRKRGTQLIGHTPARTQITWCEKTGVPRCIISHCGNEITTGDEEAILATLQQIGQKKGVAVQLAYDGMVERLP